MNVDRETRAAELLGAEAYDYFAGGAGAERVLAENVEAWAHHRLAPRVLVDVSDIDTSVTVLGRRWPHPVGVAPMAYLRHAHPDGEAGLGRAAAASGAMLTLSTQSTTPPAEVAAGMGEAGRWFQLYVFRDRGVTDALVAAAREGGFDALVLTVDFPAGGARDRGFRFVPTYPTLVDHAAGTDGAALTVAERHALHDPSLTWDDIAGFAEASVAARRDQGRAPTGGCPTRRRRRCGRSHRVESWRPPARRGAQHGRRPAPIVDAVAGRASVLVDGGIRRGWDVARALALGADASLVGRPVLWGLATGGEAGARQVIEEIVDELASTLALIGCPQAARLDESGTGAPMTSAIEVTGLQVVRGGTTVLPGLDLTVRAGTITGLLGPSGCGKTTLIRALAGVQDVVSGQVTVLGDDAGSARNRARVAYMTQASSVYPDLTVRQNLDYFAALHHASAAAVEQALADVGLTDLAARLTGDLSGGQRSRVSLAAALLADPQVLLLDEPTVGLDPVLRRDLWKLFADLAGAGRTLLVSSHVMEEASRCDEVLLMREGRILAQTTPADLLERTGADDLEAAFLAIAEDEEPR